MSDAQPQRTTLPPGTQALTPEPVGRGRGLFQDASTLAATGLIGAVLLAVIAGFVNALGDFGGAPWQERMLALTNTVDVGDVALLGLAVALLLLTPDPPGGVPRPLLLQMDAVLAGVITVFGLVRSIVLLTENVDVFAKVAGFTATIGVTVAAFTIAYYAAKESFLKERGAI